jgi:hypothetical protein
MTADPLAPFRRPGALPAAPPEPDDPTEPSQAAPVGYRAYGVAATGKPLRLDIRPARGLAVARPYAALTEIAYDRHGYTGILLFFIGGKLVTVTGHHLKPVVEALLTGTCEFLAELDDGGKWQPQTPVITKIVTAQKPATAKEGSH